MKGLLSKLECLGAKNIYFCSGARNLPLLKEFKEAKDFNLFVAHDERAAAFMALGKAKATGTPSVICTTSGTALAECFPALIEAYYADVPLIIISADRPLGLKGTHSPQTIEQDNFFGPYAKTFANDSEFAFNGFPIHLNLRINLENLPTEENRAKIISTEDLFSAQMRSKKTLIVLNKFSDPNMTESLRKILREKNLFCYQEVESPFYSEYLPSEIMADEQVQELLAQGWFEQIVRIGSTPNSKFWRLLNTKFSSIKTYHLCQSDTPALYHGFIIPFYRRAELLAKLESVEPLTPYRFNEPVLIEQLRQRYPKAELSLFLDLISEIDRPGNQLFIGNSLPIRHLKFIKPRYLKIHANRGANGIDGLIATAAGVASGSDDQVHLILGDLSFMYDFSSLFQIEAKNLHLHILNNGGGKIFKRLTDLSQISCPHKKEFSGFNGEQDFAIGSLSELIPEETQSEGLWHDFQAMIKNTDREIRLK